MWSIRFKQNLAWLANLSGLWRLHRQAASRQALARRYLRGKGIEIGALHNPVRVPATARVRYVDRMRTDELRRHYPELKDLPLVPVDIVDDGESLVSLPGDSQDFVIANHFLEHCGNPLRALVSMFRVLKSGGVLYLAVPDKRATFDRERPLTHLAHLVRDYREGPAGSRAAAFDEYVRFVEGVTDPDARKNRVAEHMGRDYSIHYHVWTEIEMLELLVWLRRAEGVPLAVVVALQGEGEVILVLRKSNTRPDPTDPGAANWPAPAPLSAPAERPATAAAPATLEEARGVIESQNQALQQQHDQLLQLHDILATYRIHCRDLAEQRALALKALHDSIGARVWQRMCSCVDVIRGR